MRRQNPSPPHVRDISPCSYVSPPCSNSFASLLCLSPVRFLPARKHSFRKLAVSLRPLGGKQPAAPGQSPDPSPPPWSRRSAQGAQLSRSKGSGTSSTLRPSQGSPPCVGHSPIHPYASSRSFAFPARIVPPRCPPPERWRLARRISPKSLSIFSLIRPAPFPRAGDHKSQPGSRAEKARSSALLRMAFFRHSGIGAQIGAPAVGLSPEIQADLALRGADHTDQLPFGLHLAAAEALPHGDLLLHSGILAASFRLTEAIRCPSSKTQNSKLLTPRSGA